MSNDHPDPQSPTPLDSGAQALSAALHSSFGIVKFVMAVLFVVFLFSGFFTVGPMLFGALIGLTSGEVACRSLALARRRWAIP